MVKNWCNVLSIEGVTVCGHNPECRVTFGRGGLILFSKIPVPTIELPQRRFQTFLDISLPEKLIGKSLCPQNKTFIRGASPGVSDELWDKNTIGRRRWDVATQERKVCNMEIEIVKFVVKGSHCIWSSSRMSCNIRERGTSYCLVRSPYRPKNFLRDDFKRSFQMFKRQISFYIRISFHTKLSVAESKNKSTEGCSKPKSPETRQVQEILVSTLEHLQAPKWDRTRCPEE